MSSSAALLSAEEGGDDESVAMGDNRSRALLLELQDGPKIWELNREGVPFYSINRFRLGYELC